MAAAPARTRAEARTGWWDAGAVVIALLLWTVAESASARYALYLVPAALLLVHLSLAGGRLELDRSGLACLGLYGALAAASVASGGLGPLGLRDVAIVGSYLLVFALAGRAPPGTVDAVAAGLFACMLVEASRNGVSFSVDLLGSNGIMESNFAFPLAVVLLFYLHRRRWLASFLVGLLVFVAYKRIAIVGVLAAVLFDRAVAWTGLGAQARRLAIGLVVFLSVFSLYSSEIFDWVADHLGGEDLSANSVSLGRYEFAQALWGALREAGLRHLAFGFGPGAADALIAAKLEAGNPHNDWLKIRFDYGILGFAVFHVILAKLFVRDRLSVAVYVYTAVVMMTDNVLIYAYHQFVVFLVLRAAAGRRAESPPGGAGSGAARPAPPWRAGAAPAPRGAAALP